MFLKNELNRKGRCEMEERVKRLEQSNRVLIVGIILLFIIVLVGPQVKDFFTGGAWRQYKGVTADEMNTKHFSLMEMNTKQPKPRVMLFSVNSDVMLSMIDSTSHEVLGIGLKKDPKLGEIPYISFQTKAGLQILEPNEDGKITWETHDLPASGK
jgi:hypothetical protein